MTPEKRAESLVNKMYNTEHCGIEHFPNKHYCDCSEINYYQAKQCALVAEDFAIGFAEWCTKYRELNRNVDGKILYAESKYDDVFLIEELLEMYKMEKGL